MPMTIQSGVKDKILATTSETSKVKNAPAEMLRDLDQQMEKMVDDGKANMVTDALSRKEKRGPLEILERIGPVAYRLRLPEELSGVHNTFHVSNLKKCLADASFHVPLDEIRVDKTLRFVEEPVEIRDREVKSLKSCRILLVKVH
ncbi:hypothetical protein Tco_0324333 [Tanacetum coccineum]